MTNAAAGVISGSGTLNLGGATFTNNGTIRPGGLNTVGTLSIAGNLVNAGVVEFELQGNTPGQYDVIAATGNVSLGGGTIKANDLAGYRTLTGDTYSIITSGGSITGTPTFVSDTGALTRCRKPGLRHDRGGRLSAIRVEKTRQRLLGDTGNWTSNHFRTAPKSRSSMTRASGPSSAQFPIGCSEAVHGTGGGTTTC